MRAYWFLLSACSTMVAATAHAEAPPAPSASVEAPKAAAPAAAGKGKSPYGAKMQKGHAACAIRDFAAAAAAYKEAITDDTTDPVGYYFLGEAELAAGNVADADASFASGLRNAGSKDDIHAKLLFVIADLRERQGKWPEAKKAWDEYGQFLASHTAVNGYAATATERNKVALAKVDLDTKYAAVKQRIEQRLQETTKPPPDDGPQGPGPKKK
ncbi:MAG TPA: hypothetical protein VJT73_07480 [Polyangiaceae bacterium]|nr:hypothetical protein [Polyangiaceae bacterium]